LDLGSAFGILRTTPIDVPTPLPTVPDLRDALSSQREVLSVDHPGTPAQTARSSADGGPAQRQEPIIVSTLQWWHLPLLDDPAFQPLQALLQRCLLLSLPRRLLVAVRAGARQVPLLLVACQLDERGRHRPLGLLIARAHNRSGSCWEVQHLQLASWSVEGSAASGRTVASALLREAIQRNRGAASWIATASSLDGQRLAILREMGFQPQRTRRLWQWQAPATPAPAAPLPGNLQLRPLQQRNAVLLWHLEQSTCPAPLRQLLDRRVEDLLDCSEGRGWLLIDGERNEAVAAIRWLADHPAGGALVEWNVHEGWRHLLGPPCQQLLTRLAAPGQSLWLHTDFDDSAAQAWLTRLGAEERGDQVLMARTVWRRQEGSVSLRVSNRLGAVLEQLQPGRRPVPTPLGQR
jgi:hypothetical protein